MRLPVEYKDGVTSDHKSMWSSNKKDDHMMVSIDAEEASNKIIYPFEVQSTRRIKYRRNIAQQNRGYHIEWTHS